MLLCSIGHRPLFRLLPKRNRPSLWAAWASLTGADIQIDRSMSRQTDRSTNTISPLCSTGHSSLLGPLSKRKRKRRGRRRGYTGLTMEPEEPGLQAPRLGGPCASFTHHWKKEKRRKEKTKEKEERKKTKNGRKKKRMDRILDIEFDMTKKVYNLYWQILKKLKFVY